MQKSQPNQSFLNVCALQTDTSGVLKVAESATQKVAVSFHSDIQQRTNSP